MAKRSPGEVDDRDPPRPARRDSRHATEEAAKDEAFARALESQFTEVRFIPGTEWFAQLAAMRDRYRALRAKTPWRER